MGKLPTSLDDRLPGHSNCDMSQQHSSSVASSEEMSRISSPAPQDVLFGRGRPATSHPGNVFLHKIVNKHKDRYLKSRRCDKLIISSTIVSTVKEGLDGTPGRFLKRADGADHWVEVCDKTAREKVSHALRAKSRQVPLASCLKKFGSTRNRDVNAQVVAASSFAVEGVADHCRRIRIEDQANALFRGHPYLRGRSLPPQAAMAAYGSLFLPQSLAGDTGGRYFCQRSPPVASTGEESSLLHSLDIAASTLGSSRLKQLLQSRVLLTGTSTRVTPLPFAVTRVLAGSSLATPSGSNINERTTSMKGVTFPVTTRASARSGAIGMVDLNGVQSMNASPFQARAQGGFPQFRR